MSEPLSVIEAAHRLAVEQRQQRRTSVSLLAEQSVALAPRILPAAELMRIEQEIMSLRDVKDPETRIREIVAIAIQALDVPEVIRFTENELAALQGRGAGITLMWARVKLHPAKADADKIPTLYESVRTADTEIYPLYTVLGDPNELRMVNALYGAAWIVLAVARHLTRIAPTARGSGKIAEKEIIKFLRACGFTVKRATIHSRWIMPFVGKLWGYDKRTKALYPYAPAHTKGDKAKCKGLLDIVQHAIDTGRLNLIGTDLPGQRNIYIPLGTTYKACCAQLYRAWHSTRKNPNGHISREVLCSLFDVTDNTLRSWETIAGIKSEAPTFAELEDGSEHLNEQRAQRAIPILVERMGQDKPQLAWRLRWSNSYRVPVLKEHTHKGNPRARRRATLLTLERAAALGVIPDNFKGLALDRNNVERVGSRPLTKLHFSEKRTKDGVVSPYKQIQAAARRHADDSLPFAAELGIDKRYGCKVVEITDGSQQTYIGSQLPYHRENALFAENGGRGLALAHLQERVQWQ